MAISKCGNCGRIGGWEMVEQSPLNSEWKVQFIQCMYCGVPIGVLPWHNTAAVLRVLAAKLNVKLNI